MSPTTLYALIALWSLRIFTVYGADCDTSQPRKVGDPSGSDIASFLKNAVDNPNSAICNGQFPPGNDKISTYNANWMIFNVSRVDASQQPQNCQAGFDNIIEQCVSGDNFWGGSWSLNGFTYELYNSAFPSNGIANPVVSSSTTASNPAGATVVTETDESGHTVTATFVPTTLTQFTSLTEATTVTTTTTENGAPVIFPFVIGAGGIAWGILGGGPLPAGATPPSVAPPDGGDDGNKPTTTGNPTSAQQSSSSSSSSSSSIPVVTAIGDTPYPDFSQLHNLADPSGSIPTTDDFGETSTSTATSSTPPPPTSTPASPPSTSQAPTSTIAILPSSTGVSCLQNQGDNGARLSDCLVQLGRIPSGKKVCTTDSDFCIRSGQSGCKATGGKCDANGSDFFETSSYCFVGGNSGCAFVVANKLSSFGFPGGSCFTGEQIDGFLKNAANGCGGDNSIALQQGPNGYDTFCLTSSDGIGLCGA